MKCAKCGAELRVGCMYCSVCGQEAQIVSENTLLEEELLRELLLEQERAEKRELAEALEKKTNKASAPEKPAEKGKRKKKKSKAPLILGITCPVLLAILAVVLVFMIQDRNENSFSYQVEKAEEYRAQKDYISALKHYKKALDLEKSDLAVRMDMVEIYLLIEERDSAISLLHEIIEMDQKNIDAYQQLIELYQQKKDFDAILKLRDEAGTSAIRELFADFQVQPPEFGLNPGVYDDAFTVELTAEPGCKIYYTEDGSDPVENGRVYQESIEVDKQGKLTLKAVAQDENGLYSEVTEGKFELKFQKPGMPRAIPDSGTFYQPVTVELKGKAGGSIYYTWDGSDPTTNSNLYTEPIEVPEGNNVLSVIQVDQNGMVSEVLKCNYKYLPTVE